MAAPVSQRYGEKLATPDVSVADLIGDIGPIKAANLKLSFADEGCCITVLFHKQPLHFVINELPIWIQVSLFNIWKKAICKYVVLN